MKKLALDYLDYIEKMGASSSVDELFNLYRRATAEYGYDRVMYSSVSNDLENEQNQTPCLASNYSEDWIKHYVENGYIQIDPVRRYGCFAKGPFIWQNLKKLYKLSKEQELVLSLGEEAGLYDGIGIPCHSKKGELIGVGMASSVKGADPEKHIGKLHILTTIFHTIYQDLSEKKISQKSDGLGEDISVLPLSSREQEILLWSIKGKSNWDIAKILNISEHGIDFHIRNILRKLGVNSKLSAAVKAVFLGLIEP